MEGRIKWYNESKGYGFIITEEFGDVYVHRSGVDDHGYFGLQKDDPVTFEIKETPKGKQAINLKPVKA